MNMRKTQPFLFGLLLAASGFISAGCGALHMFEKSENERRLEAWKEEVREDSIPDPARRKQARADLDELVGNTPPQQTDAQTGLSLHVPPTEEEVEKLRKTGSELSQGEKMKRSAKAIIDAPVFLLHGLLAEPGQP